MNFFIRKWNIEKDKRKLAQKIISDPYYRDTQKKTAIEIAKTPTRTDIINYLCEKLGREIIYAEIGVRNPDENFAKIQARYKYSIDPCYEFGKAEVDFKMTSDEFFENLAGGSILTADICFDIIFIDGSHLAEQVDRDIQNALRYLAEDGFIIMHDCNPPSPFHASEYFDYKNSPAGQLWNGTTWKAFVKHRRRDDIHSCCIDTDWGIGIISKKIPLGERSLIANEFYEYKTFDENRAKSLNLLKFEDFKKLF